MPTRTELAIVIGIGFGMYLAYLVGGGLLVRMVGL